MDVCENVEEGPAESLTSSVIEKKVAALMKILEVQAPTSISTTRFTIKRRPPKLHKSMHLGSRGNKERA